MSHGQDAYNDWLCETAHLTDEERYNMAGLQRKTQAPETSDTVYVNLPEAEYEARLVYVADLGMQDVPYEDKDGNKKPDTQQISLGLELIGQYWKDADGNDNVKIMWVSPFNIYKSLTAKGKEIEYYKIFDSKAEDGDVPSWEAQLGKPVTVDLIHKTSGDKTYDNIGQLIAIPSKYQADVGKALTEPCVGDSEDPSNACTAALGGLAKYVWEKRIVDQDY